MNMVLKRSLGHLRPCTNRKHYGSNYAMPSNHSQFAWFFITYLILFVLFRLRPSPVPPKSRWMESLETGWKALVIFGALVAGCAVSFSRAYLHYHSSSQVLLGSSIGIVLGTVWYLIVGSYLIPLFPVIASWRVCEALLIRDTTLIPNIFLFEYSKIREENSLRLRKLRTSNRSQ
ncbi:hypothetical protein RvY_08801 [Ramazzottius varieornatus]|uniref:Phosphatidic acid phosphatase type 2/haloperoxidase domain-containing protein n=1 Tax=Ramazzottius varieornatus TaxID=947166 RepID=A0A1D1V9D2_RAMVA|nr:hypothetical protein RvY_08801 [Ramazzottius varieornatus]